MKMTCMINYVSKHKHSMISLIFSVLTSARKISVKLMIKTINKDQEAWINILWRKIKGTGVIYN